MKDEQAPPAILVVIVVLVAGFALAPPVEGAVLNLVPDLVTPERDLEEVPWAYDRETGEHLVFHYRYDGLGHQKAVVSVLDADGNEIMHALTASITHYVSDGWDANGDVIYKTFPVPGLTTRGDIVLQGDTYTYQLDGRAPVEARTFTNAPSGTFGDASAVHPNGWTVDTERERHFPGDVLVHAFRSEDPEQDPWTMHATAGELHVEANGHGSQNRLEVRGEGSIEGVTLLEAPAPSGPFVAEASFHAPSQNLALVMQTVDHQAVLAGVSGPSDDPIIAWALVMASGAPGSPPGGWVTEPAPDMPGQPDYWSLFFIDEEGTRTQVAPTWCCLDERWHTVRTHVDPATGTVEVLVDDEEPALRFTDAFEGAVERVATGDVWTDRGLWTGGGSGHYDNLALYAWEAGT